MQSGRKNKDDIVTIDPELTNLALNAEIVSATFSEASAARLFDGNTTAGVYMGVTMPLEVVVDLGRPQAIENYTVTPYYSDAFSPEKVTIYGSNDGENFTILAAA